MKKQFIRLSALCLYGACVLTPAMVIQGCSGGPTTDPATAKAELDNALMYRDAYRKSNGNMDTLDPTEKAKLIKMAGSEGALQKIFQHMKDASGTPPHTSGPSNAPQGMKGAGTAGQ